MKARSALPWVASALVHAGLLLLPVGILPAPSARQRISIDVTLAAARPSRSAGVSSGTAAVTPPRSDAPMAPAFRTVPEVTGQSSTLSPDAFSPDPSSRSSEVSGPAADPTAGQAAARGSAGAAASSGPVIGWDGAPRTVLRRRDPRFPSVLSESGQEVEGEARITVAPSGAVVRVVITRSTGYIEIDASVEAALRDYLFSRVDGRGDALGTVKFRFRLEKTD